MQLFQTAIHCSRHTLTVIAGILRLHGLNGIHLFHPITICIILKMGIPKQ